MSFQEQNAMETLIRRRVDEFMASIYLAKISVAARLQRGVAQSISPGQTPFVFDAASEVYDFDNMFDGTTFPTRLTVKTAGTYLLIGSILWGIPTSAGALHTWLRYNGSTVFYGAGMNAAVNQASTATLAVDVQRFNVNDYAEMLAVSNAGAANPTSIGIFSATRIG